MTEGNRGSAITETAGARIFFGAHSAGARSGARIALSRHPALDFAAWRDGYFGAAEEDAIVAAIRSVRADCMFIGLPTPRKEAFRARHHEALGMGVGGSVDVLAGGCAAPLKSCRASGSGGSTAPSAQWRANCGS
jgi:N-acetylglucosaminyldiphosphoundecaprenol N-acetyl-beta-D-mannosaminyltransferase